jgi:hypothetical protein
MSGVHVNALCQCFQAHDISHICKKSVQGALGQRSGCGWLTFQALAIAHRETNTRRAAYRTDDTDNFRSVFAYPRQVDPTLFLDGNSSSCV